MRPELTERRCDVVHRAPRDRATRGRPFARHIELAAHGNRIVRVPRVIGSVQRVGPIEHQRPEPFRMAQGEHLREIRAVGVPVEPDALHAEGIEDGGEIIGREGRAVERCARSEGAAARADVALGELWRMLQLAAVDRARAARAAIVHEQHVVAVAQRAKQCQVGLARVCGRIAGSALGADQRPGGGSRRGVWVVLEVDRDRAADRPGGIERTRQAAAPRRTSAPLECGMTHLQGRTRGGFCTGRVF